ncbi:DUF421 domain-containing protein [Nakamurella endophytica]|uniref:YetF C-terminal domain-containing protein n=1 Tax=Nakamurella endophytica TaxID=1748367 RepID=A0A917WHM0_9ACTN|nr:YetF domain-containing protein [Nakamurella endophytica]GGM04760.1 hypothetical protein GCM10011594_26260 [Nakamurella endophytica]
MWNDLLHLDVPVAEKILRTVLVYLVIVVLFRLTGKRMIASLNTLDFVVMFLLSNVVQNAIIGNDNSVTGGVIGAVTLVLANVAVDRLAYVSPWWRRWIEGTPTTIVDHGHVQRRTLRRVGIRQAEVDHAVRIQNGNDISDVWAGVLEPTGQFVLTLRQEKQGADHGDVAALAERLDRIERLLRDTVRG